MPPPPSAPQTHLPRGMLPSCPPSPLVEDDAPHRSRGEAPLGRLAQEVGDTPRRIGRAPERLGDPLRPPLLAQALREHDEQGVGGLTLRSVRPVSRMRASWVRVRWLLRWRYASASAWCPLASDRPASPTQMRGCGCARLLPGAYATLRRVHAQHALGLSSHGQRLPGEPSHPGSRAARPPADATMGKIRTNGGATQRRGGWPCRRAGGRPPGAAGPGRAGPA